MELEQALKKFWGFERFRPFQEQAIRSVMDGRDSLVVLPTGGGKSLCFQAPATQLPGMAVVISPLISLMKDQVDSLDGIGIEAACLNSSLDTKERNRVLSRIESGQLKILYVAPERLVMEGFMAYLQSRAISFFAIDEAHCISMWGHDFRPEYRSLQQLKEIFPGTSIHAYTATATRQVRDDIVQALGLEDAEILVGSFDRPNLLYRVERRTQRIEQIGRVLDRHVGESTIVYCLRRSDVDSVTASLAKKGYSVRPYHAGLSDRERKANQEAFLHEDVNIIVATVAFGMGIDKSNVRCVIHANAPKSIEHYQQETGRAGRDGLEAECRMFYSGSDFVTWRRFIDDMEPEPRAIALNKLHDMYAYCTSTTCRHASLVGYFGQTLENRDATEERKTPDEQDARNTPEMRDEQDARNLPEKRDRSDEADRPEERNDPDVTEAQPRGCRACDVCLGELQLADDPLTIGQKILSCVVRLKQRFGAGYTARVLCGSSDKRIMEEGHDALSTYGLLADERSRDIRDWIEQLVEQSYLLKTGDFSVLKISTKGRDLLKGEETPILLKPADKSSRAAASQKKTGIDKASWEGVDQALFARLRDLRRALAKDLSVPAYVVFSDAALRDMARQKPATEAEFLEVYGVGQKKCTEYGKLFLAEIAKPGEALTDCEPEANEAS